MTFYHVYTSQVTWIEHSAPEAPHPAHDVLKMTSVLTPKDIDWDAHAFAAHVSMNSGIACWHVLKY